MNWPNDFHLQVKKGFTLIELLIGIGIMLLMTGALLGRYPETTMKLNVSNTVHGLAQMAREAQIRGSAVDSVSGLIGGYGIYLSLANNKTALLYSDNIDAVASAGKPYGLGVGNGVYISGAPDNDLIKKTISVQQGYSFKRLCILSPVTMLYVCNADFSPAITSLDVSFSRPSTTAHIYINGDKSVEYSAACIEVHSPRSPLPGHVKSVQFYHSGMMTTNLNTCN
jgi:prepilin-type N-terminal cleavage/methylation domain-containing protein